MPPQFHTVVSKIAIPLNPAGLGPGQAMQSTMIANTVEGYPAAIVYLAISPDQNLGVRPNGGSYDIFLLRGEQSAPGAGGIYRSDGAGPTQQPLNTLSNASMLGSIKADPNISSGFGPYYGDFDTARFGPLGPEWGIAIRNNTSVNIGTPNILSANLYIVEQRP